MATATPLDAITVKEVHGIQWRAKAAFEKSDFEEAGRLALEAWEIVPEPKFGWDRSYMFLFSLFRSGRLSSHRKRIIDIVDDYLRSAWYLDGQDGPHFWRGALLFEEGQFDAAFEDLQRAAKMYRGRCFQEEDPRYKKFYDERRKGIASQPLSN